MLTLCLPGLYPALENTDLTCDVVFALTQCVDEAQRSGEESSFSTAPRLWLSGSEMKAVLQWEESESHLLPTLEKQITVKLKI